MEKLEKRLQFVITIALFFTVILDAMFKLAPNKFDSNQIILMWGSSIAVLLIDYIFLEIVGNKFKDWVYKYTNLLLLVDVGMFAVLLVINAAVSNGENISSLYSAPYGISIFGVVIVPLAILIIFIADIFHTKVFPGGYYKRIEEWKRGKMK